jgi:hypothetical protein
MPRLEDLAFSPATVSNIGSAVNATSTATIAAAAGKRFFITGLTISASGAPAAAVTVTLNSAATVIDQMEVPNGAFAPILHNYTRPLRGGINEAITLVIPALGVGIRGTAVVRGYYAQE